MAKLPTKSEPEDGVPARKSMPLSSSSVHSLEPEQYYSAPTTKSEPESVVEARNTMSASSTLVRRLELEHQDPVQAGMVEASIPPSVIQHSTARKRHGNIDDQAKRGSKKLKIVESVAGTVTSASGSKPADSSKEGLADIEEVRRSDPEPPDSPQSIVPDRSLLDNPGEIHYYWTLSKSSTMVPVFLRYIPPTIKHVVSQLCGDIYPLPWDGNPDDTHLQARVFPDICKSGLYGTVESEAWKTILIDHKLQPHCSSASVIEPSALAPRIWELEYHEDMCGIDPDSPELLDCGKSSVSDEDEHLAGRADQAPQECSPWSKLPQEMIDMICEALSVNDRKNLVLAFDVDYRQDLPLDKCKKALYRNVSVEFGPTGGNPDIMNELAEYGDCIRYLTIGALLSSHATRDVEMLIEHLNASTLKIVQGAKVCILPFELACELAKLQQKSQLLKETLLADTHAKNETDKDSQLRAHTRIHMYAGHDTLGYRAIDVRPTAPRMYAEDWVKDNPDVYHLEIEGAMPTARKGWDDIHNYWRIARGPMPSEASDPTLPSYRDILRELNVRSLDIVEVLVLRNVDLQTFERQRKGAEFIMPSLEVLVILDCKNPYNFFDWLADTMMMAPEKIIIGAPNRQAMDAMVETKTHTELYFPEICSLRHYIIHKGMRPKSLTLAFQHHLYEDDMKLCSDFLEDLMPLRTSMKIELLFPPYTVYIPDPIQVGTSDGIKIEVRDDC
ncbi:hypothetical protein BDV96DRAFT_642186 [Lophiotrema nucula]|uniref:Uncharacterized protein n=1 Tax=Lophiotrema nucula TaxID=690887 RepID=A0A6A5ZMY9_9PLEO|nr:hypothetical protein BDV96DRAFT_642186 [Lophiotrema nucula]